MRLQEIPVKNVTDSTPVTKTGHQNTSSRHDGIVPVMHPVDRSVNWSQSVDSPPEEEAVMQISGAGHWFLEGWIGEHAVDILVDLGSAVTAVSSSFYKNLREVGAPVGEIRATNRRLRGANGSRIDILGCSFCVVSFLGLQTEFPILVCDLSTDAIIGTDILGSVLPHTLDIKHCCSRKVGCLSNYTDIVLFHRIQKQFFTVPLALWVAGRCRQVDCWKG